jgi:nitroreductase
MQTEVPLPPALAQLLSRQSLGPKHLREPAPDATALARMAAAALRAPDHGELVPYRFVVVAGAARARLAQLFEQAAIDAGKPAAEAALDATRGAAPPASVAVVARIDAGHPQVPAHEQWAAVGGAIAQFLAAAHLQGYAGKMLSGAKVRQPRVMAAFCGPGETLVGWIVLGTPAAPPRPWRAKAQVTDVLQAWTPPASPSADD